MIKFLKYFYVVFVAVISIAVIFLLLNKKVQVPVEENNIVVIKNKTNISEENIVPEESTNNIAVDKNIPNKILIEVPFTTQAPFANWDIFHEEACEEAALLMMKYYLDGKKLTPEIAEREIQAILAYEIKEYGKYEDSSAEELVQLAADFYNIQNLKVVYDFSPSDLQTQLSLGKPVIVPAAGRLLGNPNFKVPGPLYHALVLVGYDGDNIITNDAGTKRGKGYQYKITTLYNAIHDFSGDLAQIEKGRKAMIVLE
jgi:uncharacterized protein YvpB